MNNKKRNNRIIILILILIFFLLMSIFILINSLDLKEEPVETEVEIIGKKEKTVQEIVEEHDAVFFKDEGMKVYIEAKVDLVSENGESNEDYFESMIKDLSEVKKFNTRSFFVVDERKNINIYAQYDSTLEQHVIIYNNKENFFEETDLKNYSKIEKVKIIDKIELSPAAQELFNLINGGMFFKNVKNTVGEGVDLGNGFSSYKDGSILMKTFNSRVKTIIFTDKFEGDVFHGVKVGKSLEEIKEKYKGEFSSNSKYGYVMYRTKDVYVFFYEHQIVIYGYSYFYNEYFEDYLEEYVNNKNLEKFVTSVLNNWNNYEICEYDFDAQYAHITYPSRGVEINITNNNPIGITLYNNYYLTNRSKSLIKDEKITLNGESDYIELTERKRIENTED